MHLFLLSTILWDDILLFLEKMKIKQKKTLRRVSEKIDKFSLLTLYWVLSRLHINFYTTTDYFCMFSFFSFCENHRCFIFFVDRGSTVYFCGINSTIPFVILASLYIFLILYVLWCTCFSFQLYYGTFCAFFWRKFEVF